MAIDHRIGNKVSSNLRKEDAGGIRVDPYPYIALIKNNYDPTRSGRLQVWIPDLGGDQDDPLNWRTVSYASPFMGYTSSNNNSKQTPSTANTFETARHSYGMWMVPPDLGVEVLVLFVAGDPLRGYWLACINSGLSHHMVPALAGSPNIADDPNLTGAVLPVVEFNEYDQKAYTNPSFYTNPKPVHKTQYNILKNQGLDRDPIRGAISSSSQRESPSHVFGISTPGRPYHNDPADNSKNFVKNLRENNLTPGWDTVSARKGGHTFVMDDGAVLGQDQLVRLRTAKGHQLLMHDTDNSIYISHANGNSWLEMDANGHIKVYAKSGLSIRSENVINLHSDGDINIHAENNIKIKAGNQLAIEAGKASLLTASSLSVESKGKSEFLAGGGFNVKSTNAMSLVAGSRIALTSPYILQNSGGEVDVISIKELKLNKHGDTTLNGMTWTNKPNILSSLVTLAPSHEPYPRILPAFFNPSAVSEQEPQAVYTGAADAIKSVPGTSINDKASVKDLRKHLLDQTVPINTVGNLSKDQVTAYLAQIGKSESGGDYTAVNSLGYVGKYQFGFEALIDGGYVKSSVTSLDQLNNPNSWTGKDGVTDKNSWLNNPSVQETAMQEYTQRNYSAMVANGAITKDMPPEEVGGMLATSHLLGANGAKNWRLGKGGVDAFGTSGDQYFQKGKFAVSVLSQQVAAVNEG
jgi:hypothetical protein